MVYDGDGNRVKKTEGGETILYVNRYYEKNLTTSEVTTYYYHGSKLVAQRKNTTLSYIHQDSLSSTSVMSADAGTSTGTIKYFSFGSTRSTSGTLETDKKFTGQRLDSTGLYYYNARYYDPEIGRFISADIFNLDFTNPQGFNRYSYVFNNPLKYVDPSGHVMYAPGYFEPGDPFPDPTQPLRPHRLWDIPDGMAILYDTDGMDFFISTPVQVAPGIFLGDLAVSGDKAIYDALNGTQVRLSNENLTKLLDRGYSYEQIALLVSYQSETYIRVTDIIQFKSDDASQLSIAGLGSYIVRFDTGFAYVGKGSVKRMLFSMGRISNAEGVSVLNAEWEYAASNRLSYIREYQKMRGLNFQGKGTLGFYNKIWSPGQAYFIQDYYFHP